MLKPNALVLLQQQLWIPALTFRQTINTNWLQLAPPHPSRLLAETGPETAHRIMPRVELKGLAAKTARIHPKTYTYAKELPPASALKSLQTVHHAQSNKATSLTYQYFKWPTCSVSFSSQLAIAFFLIKLSQQSPSFRLQSMIQKIR